MPINNNGMNMNMHMPVGMPNMGGMLNNNNNVNPLRNNMNNM